MGNRNMHILHNEKKDLENQNFKNCFGLLESACIQLTIVF